MPNRNLNAEELKLAQALLDEIKERLAGLANADPELLFAYRRKIAKELVYEERGKPGERSKLKSLKWGQQNGKCAQCGEALPLPYSHLDRKSASLGYTMENTELLHSECHHQRQALKGYT